MPHVEHIETLIIGGGQAGLATSYYLTQQSHPHLILEQAPHAAHAWRDGRWDSFTLVTPNWMIRMPGAEYRGNDPEGFLPRDEVVAYLEQYIVQNRLPIRYGVHVIMVEQLDSDRGYRVAAETATFEAANVIIATGLYQQPRIPVLSDELPRDILQIHSGAYRHPDVLPPGAVLVVGSGQSGCQIAEELYQSGRKVYLCVGSAVRQPRRYRGRDAWAWGYLMGMVDRTVDQLPTPHAKFEAHPQLTGKHGGHSLNLHQFARDGVTLLGHLRAVRDGRIALALDLKESLARADKAETEFCAAVDHYVDQTGLDAPRDALPQLQDGYAAQEIDTLDLHAAGISSVVWATAYRFDFSLVHLPVCDGDGYPIQSSGVTRYPGLYFIGLPWLHNRKSGLLFGVGEDAAWIVTAMTAAKARRPVAMPAR